MSVEGDQIDRLALVIAKGGGQQLMWGMVRAIAESVYRAGYRRQPPPSEVVQQPKPEAPQ